MERRHEAGLRTQRALGYLVGALVLWPLVVGWMRYLRGYRIHDLAGVRRRARRLLEGTRGPVLICPNHLTWIDSLLVQWAITSPGQVLRSYRLFAWNAPERTNFYGKIWLRLACYLGKCVPVVRGGDRSEQTLALEKLSYVLRRGELVTLFPEGSRSRTGRLDPERLAQGVGRLVKGIPDCRVLCVYLRGDGQDGRSVLPPAGQRFDLDLDLIAPRSEKRGVRGTREVVLQIMNRLAEMEKRYYARR
jgi:1-acyl-sn-glycerol-3-phosphate acyltransferase